MTITETIARGIAVAKGIEICADASYEHSAIGALAKAAINALTEAGYAIVPMEPTMFQLVKLGAPGGTLEERGIDPGALSLYDIYAAVIAATPLDSEKGE